MRYKKIARGRKVPHLAMLARTTAVLALAGAASAFSPMMSMETGRRQIVQAGAAAAVAAPLLRSAPAQADGAKLGSQDGNTGRTPIITIFDHRGCQRGGENKEYTGAKSGDQDDEMCVKLRFAKLPPNINAGNAMLNEVISFKAKGIDGPYTSNLGMRKGY
jgi:hypothetical protein